MLDGQGCLLPVLRQCRTPEEEQQPMVRLLLPSDCTAEVVQRLHDVKSRSLPEEKRKRRRRPKLNSTCKVAIQILDPQDSATKAGDGFISQDAIYIAAEAVALPGQLAIRWRSLEDACQTVTISECSFLKQQEVFGKSEGALHDEEVVDKSYIPGLPDSVALICLAYLPLTEHRMLAGLSRRHRELVRDSVLLNLRREIQSAEQWICIYTSGNNGWTAFDPKQNKWRNLPHAVVDPNFEIGDKESLAAGPHLLWLGQEAFEFACYKYDLLSNSWERGPRMLNPRCLFGSATCGEYAFVAGGFSVGGMQFNVLSSAERYNSLKGIWEPLPPMSTPRQKCSGFFMDGKFYVIGGKTRDHEQLTSGEEYDPVKNVWRIIENMYLPPVAMASTEPSPPLVAVAGNELYALESSSNLLKAYEKRTNTWKVLGQVPVRADFCNGWGLAFKALGDTLYVIGGHRISSKEGEGVAVFSWRPQPGARAPEWQLVNSRVTGIGNFLFNCAIMSY